MQQRVVIRQARALKINVLPSKSKKSTVVDGKIIKSKPSKAGAAFDDETFLSGIVVVPPLSVKDREETASCTQIFMVMVAQDNSVCVRIADRKYMLSQGDHFWIPKKTSYMIENFSSSVEAKLSFVLIKPTGGEVQGSDSGSV